MKESQVRDHMRLFRSTVAFISLINGLNHVMDQRSHAGTTIRDILPFLYFGFVRLRNHRETSTMTWKRFLF